MKAMLEPRIVAANTHGRARSAQPDVSATARMTPSSQGARPKLIIGCLVRDFLSSAVGTEILPRGLKIRSAQCADPLVRWPMGLRLRWNFAPVKSFGFYEIARGTPGTPGAHSSAARSHLPMSAAAS
jgi:hypothetical protein